MCSGAFEGEERKRGEGVMKDYLNADEKNQIMVLMSIKLLIEGESKDSKMGNMLEAWMKRNNMTKDEHKSLKTALTYLEKFTSSVFERLSFKEQETLKKKLRKFDFRLVDDYVLQKIYRDINNKRVNAVMPRALFYRWCEEIMDLHCKGCSKNWNECELHEVFEENFVPESSWMLESCRYAYREREIKK
jgi:hypothetical protein